jgi:excisionase family DNA binding protein
MQPDADRTERLTVRQAAERLGISAEAVRQRIKRDTLRHVKDAGTVYVLFDTRQDADRTTGQALIVARLDSEVAYLRQQLEQANERDRENRRIIAALTQRIPELPPAPEPSSSSDERESPETATPDTGRGSVPGRGEAPQHRPWWRRVFGR